MDYDPRPGINARIVALEADNERLRTENARLQEAKRMAGLIADERSKENVTLRAALKQLIADYEDVPDPTDSDAQAVFAQARAALEQEKI